MSSCQWCGCQVIHDPEEIAELSENVRRVLEEVAEEHNVTVQLLRSPRRRQEIVDARACATKRLRQELMLAWKVIEMALRRDHSSLIYLERRKPVWRCPSIKRMEATG